MSKITRRPWTAEALWVFLLISPGAAAAQPSDPVHVTAVPAAPKVGKDPQETTATFGDWTLRCRTQAQTGQPGRVCEVVQIIQVRGQQLPFAQIALSRQDADQAMRAIVVVPVNISLPSVASVSIGDHGPSAMMAWSRCVSGGCFAETKVALDVLRAWRVSTGQGRLTFDDAAGREVQVPLSFRGLAQALDALPASISVEK